MTDRTSPRINLGGVLAGLTAAAIAIAMLAGASPAEAKWKQQGCAKFKKKIGKAKKPAAKRAAKKRFKQCGKNRRVYALLKNKALDGVRADGIEVNSVYCANGAWSSDGGDAFEKTGWRVENARIKGKNLTAIVRGNLRNNASYVIAVARRGSQWKVGWETFGQARDLGDAELTNARSLCRKA